MGRVLQVILCSILTSNLHEGDLYRSLGMLKEAEIIEQQMLSRGAGMGVTQARQQPDYSAQWAEYYR